MSTTLPETEPDIDLADDLDRQARRAAVLEWYHMPGIEHDRTDFNDLVAKHRRQLERKRGRPEA